MLRIRPTLVACACCLFWAAVGALLGAPVRHPVAGLIWGLLFGLVYTTLGSLASEKFPLEAWGATLLGQHAAPNLYEMLHVLCGKADMDLPTLYSIPRPEPNAFVVAGRDGMTAVVVTNGLTRHLTKDEVEAVMALMIARLATGAMPGWTVTATLAGLPLHWGLGWSRGPKTAWLGGAVLCLFGPPAAGLARLGWDAAVVTASDDHAAHLVERPEALRTALTRIEAARDRGNNAGEDDPPDGLAGNPATGPLFAAVPFAPPPLGASFSQRMTALFPGRRPDAAERAARIPASPTGTPAGPEDH